jgi:hypothetical protein
LAFGGNEEEEKINVKDILLDMFAKLSINREALSIAILQDSVLLLHPSDY